MFFSHYIAAWSVDRHPAPLSRKHKILARYDNDQVTGAVPHTTQRAQREIRGITGHAGKPIHAVFAVKAENRTF